MITELLIISPLLYAVYTKYIPWYSIPIIMSTVYWIPKPLITLIENQSGMLTRGNSKNIALTFDDVPYDDYTYLKIADILERHNMRGTFFIISSYVNDTDPLVELVRRGHQLGNHGKTNSMHFLKTRASLLEEIDHCDKLIKEIYEQANVQLPTTMVYRPGCGFFGPTIINVCQERGYKLCLGMVYPNDPMIPFSDINYLYCRAKIESGDIVILHDRSWTPAMLEKLLPYLKEKNHKSVTVNNLIKDS